MSAPELTRSGLPGAPATTASLDAPHIVVVGGGVSGLAAAHRLAGAGRGATLTLLEASNRLGGKVTSAQLGPHRIDLGAESLMVRGPALGELLAELDLEQNLLAPAHAGIHVYARGALRELPPGILGALPDGLLPLLRAGILSPAGLARATFDLLAPRSSIDPDCSVAALIGRRLGRQALERLFDPLLGTIYGAPCSELSLHACAPQIAALAREHRSLTRGLLAAKRPPGAGAGSPLRTLAGGLESLVRHLHERIAGDVEVRLGAAVTEIARERDGLRLTLQRDGARAPESVHADHVVIATPAPEAARLLAAIAPEASAELRAIRYTRALSVALRFDPDALARQPTSSGFLVPEQAGRTLGACTYLSAKWPHIGADGELVMRCSLSRRALLRADEQSDREVVEALLGDLRAIIGLRAAPRQSLVARFAAATPIYAPAHHERIARVRAQLDAIPELALAGAAYEGIGVPQCIASGRAAAEQTLARLHQRGRSLRQGAGNPR
ncbi:MAG TPA: protoporphyrinogen oxidase [Solirubrobacteraceae bacterium]|nr:protoporphyrinogen oxidase [Solirubrobacteraceae bacterium]